MSKKPNKEDFQSLEVGHKYGFIYRNYFPVRGCFFNGKDYDNLYDENVARERYEKNKKHMREIEIIRPPNKTVKITLPMGELGVEGIEEDREFSLWLAKVKIEPRLGYVLDQILDEYYYGEDGLFYPRETKRMDNTDFNTVFTMREFMDGMFRYTPIQVRTITEKETQNTRFIDWQIGQDYQGAEFKHKGKTYNTNFFGLYGARFRKALFPNSDFDGYPLMNWQRQVYLGRGNTTIVKAPRSGGKSLFATHLCALYLFKELNMKHEYDRPFLIIYGGLSKDANMQVVNYLKDMAKRITTNKNILRFNKTDMILTLFDGNNERQVKFVSQGQEGQGFRGLRPHLVILDEASRLNKSMYDVAAGTAEAPLFIISTTNQDDERNWFEDLYKEGVARQRLYRPVDEAIKDIWIKYGFNKIKDINDLDKVIKRNDIKQARDELNLERSIVSFKFNIYDVEYLTPEEIQMQIDKYAGDEDACLAELFNEINSNGALYSPDGLIEANIPYDFDYVSIGYDHAESWDNPAIVAMGYREGKVYVYHSQILDKDNFEERYNQINAVVDGARRRTNKLVLGGDFSHGGRTLLREFESYVGEVDYPWCFTMTPNDVIKKTRPFWYVGKKNTETILKNNFFRDGVILFSEDLDTGEGSLFEEMSNFKGVKGKKAAKGIKGRKDDQVNALMIAGLNMYMDIFRNNRSTKKTNGNYLEARRIKNMEQQKKEAYEEKLKNIKTFKKMYW